ncbi:MAG: HAMP domain-containing sensor histidine kinase [Chitinophagales bacterium]|nr:HAMP domain-containing sensor histidine kinase [Chitinophagales bacterium]
MDIYSKKTNYKLIIFLTAILIGLSTVLYTNFLANHISQNERQRARIWADAIEKRAKMLSYTYDLFNRLAIDERKKVNIWAQSTKFILTVEDNDLLNFFNDIITSNDNIPVLLVNEEGVILSSRNTENQYDRPGQRLTFEELKKFSSYPPIIVQYRNVPGMRRNYIYYQDSKLFSELKKTLNEFVEKFIYEVVMNTASSPVILLDQNNELIAFSNIDSSEINTSEKLKRKIQQMQSSHPPIILSLGAREKKYIYYDESLVIKQLRWFPIVQLAIFFVFIMLSYLVFSNARKAEQNLVWVGMAKETAHQLGTPISSLASWIELIKEKKLLNNPEIIEEIEKDVNRLTTVADRFSKIGAKPQIEKKDLVSYLKSFVDYQKKRISEKISISCNFSDEPILANFNPELFDWVLENLFKNAIDAMHGQGQIKIEVFVQSNRVVIDFSDTGHGIPRQNHNKIFEPGFSTKKRGWGLGLSLTKRIIEDYHKGKIFVKHSSIGQGTTFRIILRT